MLALLRRERVRARFSSRDRRWLILSLNLYAVAELTVQLLDLFHSSIVRTKQEFLYWYVMFLGISNAFCRYLLQIFQKHCL